MQMAISIVVLSLPVSVYIVPVELSARNTILMSVQPPLWRRLSYYHDSQANYRDAEMKVCVQHTPMDADIMIVHLDKINSQRGYTSALLKSINERAPTSILYTALLLCIFFFKVHNVFITKT